MSSTAYVGRDVPDSGSDGLPEHPTERYFTPVMRHPNEQAKPPQWPVAPVRHGYHHGTAYAMWMNREEMRREGLDGQQEGGYVPPFSQLSRPAQKRVADIIASKGPHIVDAAGLTDFVERHHVPVAGVERTVQ